MFILGLLIAIVFAVLVVLFDEAVGNNDKR